jgi:hypothetical protein
MLGLAANAFWSNAAGAGLFLELFFYFLQLLFGSLGTRSAKRSDP